MTRWWKSTGRRTKEARFLRSVTPYKRWPNRLPFRPCSRTKRVIKEVAHQRRQPWVLSQNAIFGQNPKIGCQECNDLQTPKLSKKQLCDRTIPFPIDAEQSEVHNLGPFSSFWKI